MKRYSLALKVILSFVIMFSSLLVSITSASQTYGWANKANMPVALAGAAVVEHGGKVYVFGGSYGSSAVGAVDGTKSDKTYVYDPSNNTWTAKTSMSKARTAARAVSLNGKIYVIGGYDSNLAYLRLVEIYDPATDAWSLGQEVPSGRAWAGAVASGGSIYYFGGQNYLYEGSKEAYRYDPASNTWTALQNMPFSSKATGAADVNGRIFIISDTTDRLVWEYVPGTNSYTTKQSLPALYGGSTAVLGNTIYTFSNGPSGAVHLYDIANDTWSTSFNMKNKITSFGTATIDGEIYVVGGGTVVAGEITNETLLLITLDGVSLTATGADNSNILTWTVSPNATSYVVKRSTQSGGPYTTLASNFSGSTLTDNDVEVGVTYYYVVTATSSGVETENSNEASATPTSEGRALLTIYISGGQIKEYDLSEVELNAFLNWYDAKDLGAGPAKYAFTKTWNKGPFKSRTEYVIFDKILTFDVDEYEAPDEE